jgi:hypothetical protein
MNLATIKEALSAWVVAASGLPDEQVVWSKQSLGLRLPEPYIVLSAKGLRQIGQAQIRREARDPDEEQYIEPGEELRYSADSWSDLSFRVQAFGDDALGLLETVKAKVVLPSIRDALVAANIGLNDIGPVSEEGGVPGPGVGPRAVMDAVASVADTVSEYEGFIDWATIENQMESPSSYVDVDVSPGEPSG